MIIDIRILFKIVKHVQTILQLSKNKIQSNNETSSPKQIYCFMHMYQTRILIKKSIFN